VNQFDLKNDPKLDSILKIKKSIDREIYDSNYYSIQVFSGNYKNGDSIINAEKKLREIKREFKSAFIFKPKS